MPLFEPDYLDAACLAAVSVAGLRRYWWPDVCWRWRAKPLPTMWTVLREPGSFEVWAGRLHVCICPPGPPKDP